MNQRFSYQVLLAGFKKGKAGVQDCAVVSHAGVVSPGWQLHTSCEDIFWKKILATWQFLIFLMLFIEKIKQKKFFLENFIHYFT